MALSIFEINAAFESNCLNVSTAALNVTLTVVESGTFNDPSAGDVPTTVSCEYDIEQAKSTSATVTGRMCFMDSPDILAKNSLS
jgi:hypothetical protein